MYKRIHLIILAFLTALQSTGSYAALTAVGDTNVSSSNDAEVIINDEVVVGDSVAGSASAPSGTLQIDNGTKLTVSNQYLYVGRSAGSAGLIKVDGASSALNFDQFLSIGEAGYGQLDITNGGTVNLTGNVFSSFAKQANSSSVVNITGPGSSLNAAGAVRVGDGGNAVLNVSDQAIFNASQLIVGNGTGSSGTVNVSNGGQLLSANAVSIGNLGTGAVNVNSGATVSSAAVRIGSLTNSVGALTVAGAGSRWDAGSNVVAVGVSGAGTLTLSDSGELQADSLILGQRNAGEGVLNIGGERGNTALTPGQLALANGIAFGDGGGEINFNHTASDYIFASTISGNGDVNVLSGKTILQGVNSYSGTTQIDGGELGAGAVGSFSQNSAFTIGNAGTLSLNGYSQQIAALNNSGTVLFAGNSPGTNLTVTGDYDGQNGLIVFNSALGKDDSPTDRLIVEGNTSGTTRVQINNMGGSGANTLNGIELVNVGGVSNGEFTQEGRIVAGAYDYHLARGEGANAGNWYLSNEKDDSGEGNPGDGGEGNPGDGGEGNPGDGGGEENPGDGGGDNGTPGEGGNPEPGTGVAILRPEGGAYAANLNAMNRMFNMKLSDRQGETRYTDNLTGEEKSTSLWIRNVGGHSRSNDESGQLKIRSNSYALMIGGDIANQLGDENAWHVGALAGYGYSQSNVNSKISGYRAKGSVQGYTTGVYGTWYGEGTELSGPYLDSVLQYSWFNNYVNGEDVARENYKANGLQTAIETGWVFKAGQSGHMAWYLKPNALIGWSGIKMDDHRESNGTRVSEEGNDNVRLKAGMRFFGEGHSSLDDGKARSFRPYIETNYIHNTQLAGVRMDGQTVTQSGTRNVGEIGAGVEGLLTDNVNLTGEFSQEIGDKGYSNSAISLGLKYTF